MITKLIDEKYLTKSGKRRKSFYCKKHEEENRKKYYTGRKTEDIKQINHNNMEVRHLTKAEIKELEKIYQPPLGNKNPQFHLDCA